MRSRCLLFAAILASVLICNCSNTTSLAGGAGGETTNGFTAAIHATNGLPAAGALVRVRPADFLSGTAVDTSEKSIADTVTDSTGHFTVRNLKPGDYAIEISGGTTSGVLIKQKIFPEDTIHDLGDVGLFTTGSVQGQVDKTNIGDSVQLTVRFYGLDRQVACLSDGRFTAPGLPASLYTLRVSANYSNVGNLDVPLVSVTPGRSTTLNPVTMPVEYLRDSVVVRNYLNTMNLTGINWDSTIEVSNGRIRTLDLTGLGLTSLDSSISKLNFLWTLCLGGNRFTSLPSSIKQLPILSHINFKGGQLDSLPAGVTALTNLGALTLTGTGIKTLPASMANMTALAAIFLDSCRLDSIPSVIFSIPSLTEINLGQNNISVIPPLIGNLVNLQQVWINDNPIASLPDEIGNLARLHVLYAYRDQIAVLPSTMGQIGDSLQTLHLEMNQLTSLPASLVNCHSITSFGIAGNSLCTLTPEVESWIASILGSNWRSVQGQIGCP